VNYAYIQEEWRVKMTPMEALFLKCHPVIHITAKCKSEAHEYPPEIPHHITKFLEVQIVSITNQYIYVCNQILIGESLIGLMKFKPKSSTHVIIAMHFFFFVDKG